MSAMPILGRSGQMDGEDDNVGRLEDHPPTSEV